MAPTGYGKLVWNLDSFGIAAGLSSGILDASAIAKIKIYYIF